MWYRAQVIQYYEETEEILIKFMDYGGYATVSENSIKQIRCVIEFTLSITVELLMSCVTRYLKKFFRFVTELFL